MKVKNTVIIAVSLLIVALFIGTAMTPTTAGSLSQESEEEGCKLCANSEQKTLDPSSPNGGCETCREAVEHTIDFTIDYVQDNLKGRYFLWRVDAVLLILEGVVLGWEDSGYQLQLDMDEIQAEIEYWLDLLVGQQIFFVTLFLAKLVAIAAGIASYLITFCLGSGNAQGVMQGSTQIQSTQQMAMQSSTQQPLNA